jgi:chemotaxis protein MotB
VLNTYGVASERLLIIGYGDQFPLMDNTTEVGRKQNRRVNIVLSKDSIVKRMPTEIDAEEAKMASIIEPIPVKSEKKQGTN